MNKILSVLLIFIIFSGCSKKVEITLENPPLPQAVMQLQSDFNIMRAVFEEYSDERLKPVKIVFRDSVFCTTYRPNKEKNFYLIELWNNRGVWVHELMHYFQDQLNGEKIDKNFSLSNRDEFSSEVAEHLVNGTNSDDYKRYFTSIVKLK